MAFKNFDSEVFSLDRDLVIFRLTIPTNGATTPVRAGINGNGYTVARTGVGIYTLTPVAGLRFPTRPAVTVSMGFAALTNAFAQVLTYNTTTGVITIVYLAAGVAAEWPAANADNVLNVTIVAQNSSQLPRQS